MKKLKLDTSLMQDKVSVVEVEYGFELAPCEIEVIGGGGECNCICKVDYPLGVMPDHHVCFGNCSHMRREMQSCIEIPKVQIFNGVQQISDGFSTIAKGIGGFFTSSK